MTELSATRMTEQEREERLLALVQVDYDATLRTISSVLATATAVRAAGFATWAALIGFSVEKNSWAFSAMAGVALVLFGILDALHSSLYRRCLHKAIGIESLLDSYVDRLGINADYQEAVLTTIARLETHRFGVYRTMRKLQLRDLIPTRPWFLYRVIYPAMFALAIALSLIFAF